MFDYGKPVYGESFFDRSELKKEVSLFIANGTDFMIKAPRRYGKTSLILEVLGDREHIYLDFRRVPRLDLVSEELIDQAFELLGIRGFFWKVRQNALSFLKELRLSAKANYELIELGAEIVLGTGKIESDCEKLVNALDIANKVGESLGRKITVVYDEFQDIKRLECDGGDILEVLRGTLQHKAYLHSVFLGSIESIMTQIFENKKSPFFNYCRKINLQPFDIGELDKELSKAFKRKQMVFENDSILTQTLERLRGHPANTMLTMQMLYFMMLESNEKLIKGDHLMEAFERAYFEQLDLVSQYVSEIKKRKHYHDVIYRIARGSDQELSSQALYQVRKGLTDLGFLVQKERDSYVIADSFLEEYLKR